MTTLRTPAKILSWTLSAALILGTFPLVAVEAVAQNATAAAGTVSNILPVPGMLAPSLGGSVGFGTASQGLGQLSSPLNGSLPGLVAPAAAAVSQVSPSAVSPAVEGAHPLAVTRAVAVYQSAPAAAAVSGVSPSAVSPAVEGAHPLAVTRAAAVSQSAAKSVPTAASVYQASPLAVSPAVEGTAAVSRDSSLAALQQTDSRLSKPGASVSSTLSSLYEGAPKTDDDATPPAGEVAAKGFRGQARSGLARASIGATAIALPAGLIASPLLVGADPTVGIFGPIFSLLAEAGNLVGNGLAIYMPIPQVQQTAKDGHSKGTPIARALLMVAASLAMGLINAPIAGNMFWGVQNIFGGLLMLAVLPIGLWLHKRGKGGLTLSKPADPSWSKGRLWLHHLLYDRGLHLTLGTVAVGVPLSIGMYLGAAAFVPALLASILPAAVTIPMLTLAIQALTGLMFLLMFLPDVGALLRGKPSRSFTPSFSLSFFVGSVGFVLWSLHAALSQPAFSAGWMQFMIYTALNAVYAAVSFASYRVAIRNTRKTAA